MLKKLTVELLCDYTVLQFCSFVEVKQRPTDETPFVRAGPTAGVGLVVRLEAVTETDHEVKHLGWVISPLIIAVP